MSRCPWCAILIWIHSARLFASNEIFLDICAVFNKIIILYNAFNNLTMAVRLRNEQSAFVGEIQIVSSTRIHIIIFAQSYRLSCVSNINNLLWFLWKKSHLTEQIFSFSNLVFCFCYFQKKNKNELIWNIDIPWN